MKQLTANKTKMIQLCQELGYYPPRNARFTKAFRKRSWWLEWSDEHGVFYRASFSTSAGRAYLGFTQLWYDNDGDEQSYWTCFNVTNDQLSRLAMVEDCPDTPPHRSRTTNKNAKEAAT